MSFAHRQDTNNSNNKVYSIKSNKVQIQTNTINLNNNTTQQLSHHDYTLLNNNDLVSIEQKLPPINVIEEKKKKNSEIIPFKKNNKQANNYIANRDTLYIPEQPKIRKPIDISNNIIESKPKIQEHNIGIQYDPIEYVDPTKPFIPQKIGKDCGTQIEDGDLFCFDIDVKPILTVLTGKILEQTLLELNEEHEIMSIRETKARFVKKNHEERARVKKIEIEETNRKKEIDNSRKIKKIDKLSKVNSQQKLTCRISAKRFLTFLNKNAVEDLSKNNFFTDFSTEIIKDVSLKKTYNLSEKVNNQDTKVEQAVVNIGSNSYNKQQTKHNEIIKERHALLQRLKEEEELRLKLEAEENERKRLAKLERKRLKKLRLLKENIKSTIILAGQVNNSNEHHNEDITDIYPNENQQMTPVLGGLLTQFILALSILKQNFFMLDNYHSQEIITEIINMYITDSGRFTLNIDNTLEEQLFNEIEDNTDFDFATLKENANLTQEDWVIISNKLSTFDTCNDIMLKKLYLNNKDTLLIDFYPMILKALFSSIEKGSNGDKVNLNFDKKLNLENEESINNLLTEKVYKDKQAFCLIETNEDLVPLLEQVDFTRDKKFKKLKLPQIEIDGKAPRVLSNTTDLNIIAEDCYSEFFITERILETCLRVYSTKFEADIDAKPLIIKYHEIYLEEIAKLRECLKIEDNIQKFDYMYFEEDVDDDDNNM